MERESNSREAKSKAEDNTVARARAWDLVRGKDRVDMYRLASDARDKAEF